MSRSLTDLGIDHVVLERGEVGNSWKTERWDSLRLLTPNWMSRLPGHSYECDDPDGYMDMDQVIDFVAKYADAKRFPLIPCNLCGSQDNLQRKQVKQMLREWERESPGRVAGIFRALQNVALSQLADRDRFDFAGLAIDRSGSPRPYAFDAARVAASGTD